MRCHRRGCARFPYGPPGILRAGEICLDWIAPALIEILQDSPTARQAFFEQVRQHSIATDGLESPLMTSDGLELIDLNPH